VKKAKAKLQKIYIDIYSTYLYYLISTRKEFNEILKKKFKEEEPDIELRGVTYEIEYKGKTIYFIWVDKDKGGWPTFAHEIFHATAYILRKCGIKYTGNKSSEETYAYLLSYIIEKILKQK